MRRRRWLKRASAAAARPGVVLAVFATAALFLPAVPAIAQTADASAPDAVVSGYVPHRVYDARAAVFTDFEALASEAAGADIVLFGEQHDDDATHRIQLALLEGLARRGVPVILSLEMFERDVQPLLDAYLAGTLDEAEFLAGARPWPNYAAHYRPLVELARARGWPVRAANVPRRFASAVVQDGLAAIHGLAPAQRGYAAAAIVCPEDAYRARFLDVIGRHPMGEPLPPAEEAARAQRYYLAQCVKDETMAETVAAAARQGAVLVHITGAFHSDHRDGTTARVIRRAPAARVLTVSALPVADLDGLTTADARADYILFTERPRQ